MSDIIAIRMPKWGLSMQEGAIIEWLKREGDAIGVGDDLVEIETSKITNVCESPHAGVLRKVVAKSGEKLPVGALMGVLAEPSVGDQDIADFIDAFQANFTPEADEEGSATGLKLSMVEAGDRALRVGRIGEGDGTPVVLIHGYSGDLNSWMFNVEALADRAPVIAIDLPGHGGSSKDVGDGSLKMLAQTVASALSALGVDRAHLVGHSLGAAVAVRLAADQPGLPASLTLIAPAYLSAAPANDGFLLGVIEAQQARDLKPVLQMLVADPGAISKDMVEDMLKFKRTDGVEDALSLIRDRMVAGDDARALARDLSETGPALVIASRNDLIVGAPDEAALPAGYRVVWIDEAGHMPHLEQAATVNALLAEAIS